MESQRLYRVAKPIVLLSGVMVLAYAGMKAATPTTSDITQIEGRRRGESYEAQTMRFLQLNARSNNPIWKLEPLPKPPPVSPKDAKPSKAQLELTQRNLELKRRMEEKKKKRSTMDTSSPDKLQ